MIAGSNLPEIIASRYRPVRLIATGGMGAVFEVEHIRTGERLALKVLSSGANASPDALARFKHEARASARIRSDNVVRVTDADIAPELGGVPFLVMELLEGTDLEHAAKAAPPAPATVVEWLRQVARAIDKAHALGIVHRDLKPENLFLAKRQEGDGSPQIKILDFGIVKMIEEGTAATGTGQILGTPKYMAPEQASANAPVTPATDRCALGLIAYRLLVGESYYQGGVMVILGQLLHGQLQAPSARGSRLGDGFDGWFLKACHRSPNERFASASEQIEALAVALGLPPAPIEAAHEASSPSVRPPDRRPRLALIVAVSVVVVIAAVVVVAARRAITTSREEALVCGLPNGGATPACGACMVAACCREAQECAGNEGCAPIETCVRSCASGDAVCRARCYSAKGRIAQLQQGVESCRTSHCATECLPGPWECLGRVKWQLQTPPPQTITIKTLALCPSCGAGGGPAPLAGTTVRVCSIADPKCDHALASSTTDDSGAAALKIDASLYPPPLAVFLEHKKNGFADTLVHLNTPPVTGDLDVGRVLLPDPKVNIGGTATMLGTTYDPARAFAGVYPTDCNGQLATKKVAVTWLDRDNRTATLPFFVYSGKAIALNLPTNAAGVTRIVARVADTGQVVATTSVVVRPGATTTVSLAPTP
jgi:serine/threonine-protein kinase